MAKKLKVLLKEDLISIWDKIIGLIKHFTGEVDIENKGNLQEQIDKITESENISLVARNGILYFEYDDEDENTQKQCTYNKEDDI